MQATVLCVRHESDDFKHGLFHGIFKIRKLRDSYLLPDWIFIRQVFFHKRLVHNRELARSAHFRFRETPSVHKLDFQHWEISLADQLKHGVPFFPVRLAGNLDVARNATVWRQRARFCSFQDTGQCFQPLQQRPVESRHLIGRLIPVHWQRKPRHQNMIRLQPEVHLAKRHKAAH